MKKLLLIASAITILFSNRALAQAFVTKSGSSDTASAVYAGGGEVTVSNYIKASGSTPADSVVIRWRVTSLILGTNWTNGGFCDNYNCRSASQITSTQYSKRYGNAFADFHMVYDGVDQAPVGSYSVARVSVSDSVGNNTRTLYFIGYKNSTPAGVNTIVSDDNIVIFPNPAREAVNVVFDDKADIKSIAVFNLIGKVLNVYKTTDNGSAKLDISNIPAGIYFLRLMNGQGQVVATRRFTRQ